MSVEDTTTLRRWFDRFTKETGETPTEIVIEGAGKWNDRWPAEGSGLIPFSKALRWMHVRFDDGYGSPGCPCFTAWSKSWVLFPSEYDGSTTLAWVRRNPNADGATMI